jgi:hypothetical protein
MLGLDSLGSTGDLTMGEAGRLVRMLLETGDRSKLPAPGHPAAEAADGLGRQGERLTLAAVIKALVVMSIRGWGRADRSGAEPADDAAGGRSPSERAP